MAFLRKLSRSIIDAGDRQYWPEIIGSVDATLQQLSASGVIKPASVEDRLLKLCTSTKLKDMLRVRQVKLTGKKPDLVQRVLAAYSTAELLGLVGNIECYELTDTGKQELETFDTEMAAKREATEQRCLQLLLERDIAAAFAAWLTFESESGCNIVPGRSRPPMLTGFRPPEAVYFLNDDIYADLDHPVAERRAVGAAMAFRSFLPDGARQPAELALARTGGTFRCRSLEEYLRSGKAGGYARNADPDDPHDLFDVYHHTKRAALWERDNLRELLSEPYTRGIEISHGGCCDECEKGKMVYRKSELSILPKLPRHWGCVCTYLSRM